MNIPDPATFTTLVWWTTLCVAVVDTLLILAIWRFLHTGDFLRMNRWVLLISFVFYTLLWSSVLYFAWDWFYQYVFPPWVHNAGLVWGLAYGAAGLGMAWLSQRLPGNAPANFCLLGGLEGLLTHIWAIYFAGAASKPPLFRGVDPEALLIFAIFEKAFYWIIILLLSFGLYRLAGILHHRLRLA